MVINELLYLDNEGIHRVGAELGDGEPGVGAVGVDGPHRGTSELLTVVLVNHLGGDRHDEVGDLSGGFGVRSGPGPGQGH